MRKWYLLVILLLSIFISVGCSDNNLNNTVSTDNGKEKNIEEIKTDTGSFIEINDNKIKIQISGTPNEISAKVFSLTKEAKAKFAELNLKKYDDVRFTYFKSDGELNVISEINDLK